MINLSSPQNDQNDLTKELYLFLAISTIAGMVYGSYYSIFLYQHTLDLRILIVDGLAVGISTWVGYILGTFWIHRSGYVKAMRLSFLVSLIAAILTFFLINYIKDIYVLFSVLRGFSAGIYAAVLGSYLLKEIRKRDRNNYYYLSMSFNLLVGIVLPLTVGVIVTYLGGFKVTFALAAVLFAFGLLLPMRYNKRPDSEVSLRGVINITRLPHFKEFGINRIIGDGADQLNSFMLAIVPYLIIKTVFGVGVLSSAIAVIAAATAYGASRFKLQRQLALGYLGTFGRIAGNLALVASWSTTGLIIRSLMVQLVSIFTDPISNRINIENTEHLLGAAVNNKALEVDMIDATLTLVGQIVALGSFLLLLTVIRDKNVSILKVIFAAYSVWKLLNYIWIRKIHSGFKRKALAASSSAQFAGPLTR